MPELPYGFKKIKNFKKKKESLLLKPIVYLSELDNDYLYVGFLKQRVSRWRETGLEVHTDRWGSSDVSSGIIED